MRGLILPESPERIEGGIIGTDFLKGGVLSFFVSLMSPNYDIRTVGLSCSGRINNDLFEPSALKLLKAINYENPVNNSRLLIPGHGQRSVIVNADDIQWQDGSDTLANGVIISTIVSKYATPHRFQSPKYNLGVDVIKSTVSKSMPIITSYSADCVTMAITHRDKIYSLHAGLEGITNGTVEKVLQDIFDDGLDIESLRLIIPPALWLVTIPRHSQNYQWLVKHKSRWEDVNLTMQTNSNYPVYDNLREALQVNNNLPDTFKLESQEIERMYEMQTFGRKSDCVIFLANAYLKEVIERYTGHFVKGFEEKILFYPDSTLLDKNLHSYRGTLQPYSLTHGKRVTNRDGRIVYLQDGCNPGEEGNLPLYSNNVLVVLYDGNFNPN